MPNANPASQPDANPASQPDANPHPPTIQYENTIETQRPFHGRIFNVRIDTVELPNGRRTTREIAEHPDSVCIIPIDHHQNVLLVRQYRKPAETSLLEAPAGGIEPGETPQNAVLRELQEETAHTAAQLHHLATFYIAPGWTTEKMHTYLASNLTPSQLPPDYDENIQIIPVPFPQALTMIQTGQIQDAKTIAALLLAQPHLPPPQ